jgi:hypothetical protein
MDQNAMCIYQSGQPVLVGGLYEVVGASKVTYKLLKEDTFPDYDGRAVCWHLVSETSVSQPAPVQANVTIKRQ